MDPFLGGVDEEMSMSESVTPAQGVYGSLSGGGGLRRRCRCLNLLHQPKAYVDPFLGEGG